jgi:hypothetical protein
LLDGVPEGWVRDDWLLVDTEEGLSAVEIAFVSHDAGISFRLHLVENSLWSTVTFEQCLASLSGLLRSEKTSVR